MHDHFCRMLCLKRIMHMLAFGCSDERGRRRWYMGRLTTSIPCACSGSAFEAWQPSCFACNVCELSGNRRRLRKVAD